MFFLLYLIPINVFKCIIGIRIYGGFLWYVFIQVTSYFTLNVYRIKRIRVFIQVLIWFSRMLLEIRLHKPFLLLELKFMIEYSFLFDMEEKV